MSNSDEILESIQKSYKGKHGIICLNCLLMKTPFNVLNKFAEKNNITISEGTKTKTGYLKDFTVHFYKEFNSNKEYKKNYINTLDYMGETLLNNEKIKLHLSKFDFISKQELIDIFSDFCADLGISVYSTSAIPDFSLDLYLIKKTPLLRTEAVFVRTGSELDEENYNEMLKLISEASKVAIWTVFVTTPTGVQKIGLKRLISDMEKLNAWTYVINPLHERIHGITKGKKSKDHDEALRDKFIQDLHHEPIRAPSKVVKISKYAFKEGESYKSKSFFMYELLSKDYFERIKEPQKKEPKYRSIFRNLLIIDKDTGISLYSYFNEMESIDDVLISGFLSAMDSFVAELGGASSLKEISYQGFFVQAAYGSNIKIALFLSEPGDQVLKERLAYFVKDFEEHFSKEIEVYQKTGKVTFFSNNKQIVSMIKEILNV